MYAALSKFVKLIQEIKSDKSISGASLSATPQTFYEYQKDLKFKLLSNV